MHMHMTRMRTRTHARTSMYDTHKQQQSNQTERHSLKPTNVTWLYPFEENKTKGANVAVFFAVCYATAVRCVCVCCAVRVCVLLSRTNRTYII
jgi:hypothetical protein